MSGADWDDDVPRRRLRMTPASMIKPRPVRWLWEGRIPIGEVTLTPGRGGLGKSTFHAHLIGEVTTGRLPGAYYGEPRACVIAATEDSWDRTIVPRLMAAGAELGLIWRVDVITDVGSVVHVSLPADLDALEQHIVERKVALVSVDPLLGLVDGALDTHKDRDVRTALQPLVTLADRTGAAVLGNAHFNKGSGTDPLSLVMGSAAFGNVARAALGFARDDDTGDGVVSMIKNNLGRLDLPSLRYRIEGATIDTDEGPASVGRFVWLGESSRSVADILSDNGHDDDQDDAAAFVRHWLIDAGGEADSAEVLKAGRAAGFTTDELKKARKRIKARTQRIGFGPEGRWVWTIDTPIGAIEAIGTPPYTNGTNGTYGGEF